MTGLGKLVLVRADRSSRKLLTQIFSWPKIFVFPIFFGPKIIFDPNFFFWLKIPKRNLDPKFFGAKKIWVQCFLDYTSFWTQNFGPVFFWNWKFLDPKFVGPKKFFDPKLFFFITMARKVLVRLDRYNLLSILKTNILMLALKISNRVW